MTSIVDISSECGAKAAALRAAGIATVIRYYSRDTIRQSKRLTRGEALAFADAGLRLCVVHEARRGDLADSFEHASGVADARYARSYAALTIDQPAGSAIYFAVDFDATAAQIRELVVPYFRGIGDAFAEKTGEADYLIGVYGSGAVCTALLAAQLVRKTWLAQSQGWAGYTTFLASGRWDLKQLMPTVVAGVAGDPDVSQQDRDFGDFVLGSHASRLLDSAPPLTPVRVNARSGLRLRTGPGTDFDVVSVLPFGTQIFPLKGVGLWTLTDLQGDGIADGYVSSGFLTTPPQVLSLPIIDRKSAIDAVRIPELIRQGSSAEGLKAARTTAKAALPGYPTDGCAAHLSALLQQAGIDVPMTLGAGKLAHVIADRGWTRVEVGFQRPGDVGVCFDNDPTPAGADHIYLVISIAGPDDMTIADNQRRTDATHARSATGKDGKTPTEYFLRAT